MKPFSVIDRLLLLGTGLLAAYQVGVGIDGLPALAMLFYSLGFGALLVAALMLLILNEDALGKNAVVLTSTFLPVCLALGLVAERFPASFPGAALAAVAGVLAVFITRIWMGPRTARGALVAVHGLAGIIITGLPFAAVVSRTEGIAYGLLGLGGAVISLMGLTLAFRAPSPDTVILTIGRRLPLLLFGISLSFVLGMALGRS